MKSKIVKVAIWVIVLAAVALVARFAFGGPEDEWICNDGKWVKHGNPSAPIPETPCAD